MEKSKLAALALAVGAIAAAQDSFPTIKDDSGMVTLDERGGAERAFPAGYLGTHFCSVGGPLDEVTVGFTARFFYITEGRPDQRIFYACVSIPVQPQFSTTQDGSGMITLDKDGSVRRNFRAGYLDTHFCSFAKGPDQVAVGFSATYVHITDGKETAGAGIRA